MGSLCFFYYLVIAQLPQEAIWNASFSVNGEFLVLAIDQQENQIQEDSEIILRAVPYENGFHFNTENGVYIGVTAVSLEDFADKLRNLDAASVAYHYYRGDFQRWIDNTLGDKKFADKMCFISTKISGEQLRKELLKMLDKRLTELKGLKWVENEGI